MNKVCLLMGALLTAAPVFSQTQSGIDPVTSFQLTETREQVRERMGAPALVASFGDFESWQYQIDVADLHDFSHQFVFRRATGELISVTHTYEPERILDALFPEAETHVFQFPEADYGVRLRRLGGGRLLLAMGSAKVGQPVGQILLIRESELHFFHSWLKLEASFP
ncbi:MAG: hypothetical protein ABI811_15630 [Acidobacteriota bacterium]